MAWFRNQEIRRFALCLGGLCAAAITAGFVLGVEAGVFAFIVCAALSAAFFAFTRRRYREIARLSEQIDQILHGAQTLDIAAQREGELSILQSEIQKMTVRLREQAETLVKEKTYLADSMADIAHQLKTPLTSVNLLTALLGRDDLSEARRFELVRELSGLLQRLDWLVATLLKISKLDAGAAVFRQDAVPVNKMLQAALEPLLIPLELRGVHVSVKGQESACFTGDLQWTAEAVGNIIKNCMEHCSGSGTIAIDYAQNALYTQILIKDSGGGIDLDDLPHIFERFYQGKGAREGSFGIGLALCRMILSAQNAAVKAANGEGGAVFTVRFHHQVV